MFKRNIVLLIMVEVWLTLATSEELTELTSLAHSFSELANQFQDMKNSHLNDSTKLVKRIEELEYFRKKDFQRFSESLFELQQLREKKSQTIKLLSDEISALINENKHMESRLNGWKQLFEYHSHSTKLTSIGHRRRTPKSISLAMKRSDSSPGTIAFYISLSQLMVNPGIGQKISFDNITTNVNAHISNYTGVFKCTHDGVHVFSWQTLLAETDYIVTELAVNGQGVGSEELGATRTAVSDSSTAVVDLHLDDEVWVRLAGHALNSNIQPHLTTFSGFRLP